MSFHGFWDLQREAESSKTLMIMEREREREGVRGDCVNKTQPGHRCNKQI